MESHRVSSGWAQKNGTFHRLGMAWKYPLAQFCTRIRQKWSVFESPSISSRKDPPCFPDWARTNEPITQSQNGVETTSLALGFAWGFQKCGYFYKMHRFQQKRSHRVFRTDVERTNTFRRIRTAWKLPLSLSSAWEFQPEMWCGIQNSSDSSRKAVTALSRLRSKEKNLQPCQNGTGTSPHARVFIRIQGMWLVI